jgi:quercetin dioxygenase-like cupin family protein
MARGPSDGTWITRLVGADTRGQLTIGQADMPPMSSGPSLHIHSREDEIGLVIEGVLTVQLDDERFNVPAGGIAFLARGVPHTFANLTAERVRVIGLITPSGLEGMFEETREYMRSLSGAPDPSRITAIAERYGVKSIGPPIDVPTRQPAEA